jgi:hypothetical protein
VTRIIDLGPERVAAAVAGLRRLVPSPPERRGPVRLGACFDETGLVHAELPALTRGEVVRFLRRQGITIESLGDEEAPLAGFVFAAGPYGWAFVRATDPLPRRRFTAAHELGHFLMHREGMGRFRADTDETLREADGGANDQMEREANRFAADLLMPAETCHARAEELRREHGCCPRGVLGYRLAAELLVSSEAARYRLGALGVGDE